MPVSKRSKTQYKLEAEFHANIAKLLKQPKFIAVLDEIHDNPAIEEKVQANPKKYLDEKGVKLPTGPGWEIAAYAGNFSFRFCFFSWCWKITVDVEPEF
jgi:hypothetical protein